VRHGAFSARGRAALPGRREARALAAGNPLSFLHVSRPEIDLPEGTDLYSDAVYRKAVDNFEQLTATCPLEKEPEPSLYLYRLIMGQHEQNGAHHHH
jgi:uncharacterized protein (DUF1015 family)